MFTEVNSERVRQHKEWFRSRYEGINLCDVDEEVSDELFGHLRAVVADGYVGSGYVWVVRTPDQAAEVSDSMGPPDQDNANRVLIGDTSAIRR